MPAGHTERATVNQRRPLTEGMRELLAEAVKHGLVYPGPGSGANRARALMDRGYLVPGERAAWHPTDEGRAALEEN